MQLTGKQVIEQAFGLLGTHAPGEQIEERLIDQALVYANAALEQLSLRSSAVPGVTIQDLNVRTGVKDYWLGPTANTVPAAPAAVPAMLPGLRTSGPPERIEAATVLTVNPAEGNINLGYLRIAKDGIEFSEAQTDPAGIRTVLFLHAGAGASTGLAGPSYTRSNRLLEIWPTPGADTRLRLYLWVPEIIEISRDMAYDFPPGVARMAFTNIAAALVPVFGCDPGTAQEIHAQAGAAAGEYRRKNLRRHQRPAHLPGRWISTVSDDTIITEYDPYRG